MIALEASQATIFSRLGVMTARSDMVEIDSHECYLSVACHCHVPPIGGGAHAFTATALDVGPPTQESSGTRSRTSGASAALWGDAYAVERAADPLHRSRIDSKSLGERQRPMPALMRAVSPLS